MSVVEVMDVTVGRMYNAPWTMKLSGSVVAASVSHLRSLLRLGKVDEAAEPVRAALAAARPPNAFGEFQGGRHVPSREKFLMSRIPWKLAKRSVSKES